MQLQGVEVCRVQPSEQYIVQAMMVMTEYQCTLAVDDDKVFCSLMVAGVTGMDGVQPAGRE